MRVLEPGHVVWLVPGLEQGMEWELAKEMEWIGKEGWVGKDWDWDRGS